MLIWGKALTRYIKAKAKIEKNLARELNRITNQHARNRAMIDAKGTGM